MQAGLPFYSCVHLSLTIQAVADVDAVLTSTDTHALQVELCCFATCHYACVYMMGLPFGRTLRSGSCNGSYTNR